MSCFSFSQDLKPIVRQINNKPHFCFNQKQSKELAKLLTLGSYNDSIANHFKNENVRLRLLVENNEKVIGFQRHQLDNYMLIVDNSEVRVNLLEQKIKARDRKIRRSKAHKFILGAALLVTTTILIIK